jgi:hypothetical protein
MNEDKLLKVFFIDLPVWLEGNVIVASDIAQISFQLFKHLMITADLADGSEWMDIAKFRHTGRQHFSGTV